MMQCPQCGTDNRLGAIFCRSCGTKLELDSVTSQTFEQVTGVVAKNKSDAKKRTKRIVFNVIRLVILALLVAGVYLAMQIPEVGKPTTEDRDATLFERKIESLTAALSGDPNGRTELPIKEQEVNAYIQKRMGATDLGKGTFQLADTWVLFGKDGEITWVIDAKLFGRPLRFQYFGTVEAKDGKLVFKKKGLFTGKLGKLPYPTILLDMTTKKLLDSLLKDEKVDIEKLLDGVSELTFADEQVTVKVRRGSAGS